MSARILPWAKNYIQIMIRIDALLLLVLLACTNRELTNEYIFTEPTTEWYVIINGCKGGEDFIKGNKRKFVFPRNGIILTDMKNFQITKNDVFVINGKLFNPNSNNQESYKICYFMSSFNSGYNAN
jgi:hypothetical protein